MNRVIVTALLAGGLLPAAGSHAAADSLLQCQVRPEGGLCREPSIRFFYDAKGNSCYAALWSHCNPQTATFGSRETCEKLCVVDPTAQRARQLSSRVSE